MMKKWKKWIAAVCTTAMLMTIPGVCVLADEIVEEILIITGAEVPESVLQEESIQEYNDENLVPETDSFTSMNSVEAEAEDIVEADLSNASKEDVVGVDSIDVHASGYPGTVTATYDRETGAVEFYSNGGTLSRTWYYSGFGTIKSIRVASGTVYLPNDSREIFCCIPYMRWNNLYNDDLEKLDLSGFDTSNVTSMYCMFSRCRNLHNLDVSGFDTSNVTNMGLMFEDCSELTTLDVSGFDTSNVEGMGGMFSGCSNLTSLDVSRFDTSNVKGMVDMFNGCRKLTTLDVSGFDTSNVGGMGYMFSGCEELTTLDVSGFDTSNVTDMQYMFSRCKKLTSLDLSRFDTSNVHDMHSMFWVCSSITNLDVSGFDTSNVTEMQWMFSCCSSITYLDLSSFDTSNVRDISEIFLSCNNLQVLITPKRNSIKISLPYSMYNLAGNQYSEIPAYSDCMVLTKEPRQNGGYPVKKEVEIMDEKGDKRNEEVSFYWDVETLEYRRVSYDYDLALAAAYINQGTYFSGSEKETKARMKDLGFEHFDQNHPYNEENHSVPWMAIGYQKCTVNGTEKKIVCLNVRGTFLDSEWDINIKQGWGEGFVPVGEKALEHLLNYCWFDGIKLNDPNTILFMAGHSLGGATISRLAIELAEKKYQTKVVAYAFGTPNYSCGSLNPTGLHTVWNEGDIVASMGGMFTSHTGQIIKFRKYTLYNQENVLNDQNHEMGRYLYRTFRSAGKMSSLSANTLTYTFVDGFEDELCPIEPPIKPEQQTPLRRMYDKYGTKAVVHCPVDVRVYNADNILVGDSTNDDFMFTDGSGGYIYLNDDEKYVFLPAGTNYRLDITGTDDGTMNIDIMEIDPFGEEINSMSYENVSIETDKHFILDAQSINTVDESDLFVVQDESVPVAFVQTDGTEVPLLGSGLVCEGVTWSVDTAGELAISGRGVIPSFTNADTAPWSGLSDKITSVTIGDGITTVGTGAFAGLADLKTATVSSTVTQIGAKAFSGCTGLETVLFYGDMPEIDSSAFEGLSLEILYYNENNTWEEKPDLGEGVAYSGYCGFTSEGLMMEHSFEKETRGADCTSFGYGLYHCTTCGYAYATDFVESPGHDWGSWEVVKEATEDDDGEEQRFCLRCHEKETRIINKLESISVCTVTLSPTSYTYDGSAKKPSVTVKNGTTALASYTDYTVSYSNNKNAGTATVTVTGKGNYAGTVSKTFTIKKAAAKLEFAKTDISKKTTDAAFTNTLTKTTDGTVTFKSSNTAVATVNSTSGQVTIKGIGTTTITANAAEGTNYKAGSAGYTLTVEAPAPTSTPTPILTPTPIPTSTPTPKPAATGFSDVQDSSHPYYKAIYWAAEKGITKGYSDGTFGINRSCTRGEMMMFLWKYAKKPAPKPASKSPFKDVSSSHAFYKAILWGYQNGITKGYSDGSFGINRNVSRGEAMMFLWKLKNKPAPQMTSKSPFTDVPTSHAFYKAILWGSQKGITKGYTSGVNKGKFGINDNCTRGQIVTFLYRAQ